MKTMSKSTKPSDKKGMHFKISFCLYRKQREQMYSGKNYRLIPGYIISHINNLDRVESIITNSNLTSVRNAAWHILNNLEDGFRYSEE